MAATQLIEKSFSKPYFGGPGGLFPPGNPALEVGGFAPTSIDGLPGRKRPFGPPKSSFEKNFSKGWVPARGPPH